MLAYLEENKTGLPDNLKSGIENLSGHSMDDVKVHYNSDKPAQLQAHAYAQGTDIHLGAGQEKHLPHEAWHVVQQKQGRVKPTMQMKGKVNVNDDSGLEREADVMGAKALQQVPIQKKSLSQNSLSSKTIQRYTDVAATSIKNGKSLFGKSARIADNGKTATGDFMHICYADKSLIKHANDVLESKGSGIIITAGTNTVEVDSPNGAGKKVLTEVSPKIRTSTSKTGTQNFWADCGRSSREVMGKSGTDTPPMGVYEDKNGKAKTTNASSNPAKFRDEILKRELGEKTSSDARKSYLSLNKTAKEAFDKKHKINKYANPLIGDAFVSRRDDKSTKKGFNFHWGGVIMVAGKDKITFENFAKKGTDYNTKDEKWYFETYGPPTKKGQTFHERNESSVGAKGKNNTTMSATTTKLNGVIGKDDTRFVKSPYGKILEKSNQLGKLKKNVAVKVIKRGTFWDKVTILSGSLKNTTGWIMKKHFVSN